MKTNDEYTKNSGLPTRQASSRYKGCDKQLDCTAVTDELSATSGSIESLRHNIIRTRSGQEVCRPLKLGIDV